jgi:hypothetical protein
VIPILHSQPTPLQALALVTSPRLQLRQKQCNQPYFRNLVFFFNNILPIFHLLNMFVIILFHLCPQDCSGFRILIFFSRSVALFSIAFFLFVITFDSCRLISIALRCGSTITYTFVSCCTSTCTFVDSYCFVTMTFFSLPSLYIVYASTKCCCTISSSSNFSMNTKSINVPPSPIYSFACQRHLLMRKISIVDVPIISMY